MSDAETEKRIAEIVSAMDQYNEAGMTIPADWFTELYALLKIKAH